LESESPEFQCATNCAQTGLLENTYVIHLFYVYLYENPPDCSLSQDFEETVFNLIVFKTPQPVLSLYMRTFPLSRI